MKNIYFIKNKEGKFLNYKDGKNPFLVSSIISATPSDKPQQVTEGFEVISMDVEEFKDIYSMTVSELVIIGELFFRKAKIYQDTIPVLPKLNKDVRNAVRNVISKMSFFHNQLNDIIENDKEEGVYALSGDFEELINHVSKAIDGDMRKYNQVFRAMEINENAILGIAKKYDDEK